MEGARILVLLFWLEGGLFLAGSLAGGAIRWLREAPAGSRARLQGWALRAGLASLIAAGTLAAGAAARFLLACGSRPAGACSLRAVVWNVPQPVLQQQSFDLVLYVDPLAALFVLLTGFFTACVALYSAGWVRDDEQAHRVTAGFALFAATTLFTLVVGNGFWLLAGLELMSLTFGYLVLYRWRSGRSPVEGRRAIQTYFVVNHLSTALLFAAILIMGVAAGSLDFGAFHDLGSMRPEIRSPVFLLLLLGLGVRAGMVPFHFWVPIVHPQSPTTTHAFSLGVSIKVALYLMIRFFFEFLGSPEWWWGIVVLLLAGLTALVNVFYALVSSDLKRALAFHSVENVGIILAGIGLALLFDVDGTAAPLQAVARLALVAALFHTLNHALFKGLLYLATGSIERKTGTVEMEALGGLLRRLPWTGLAFLTGATAIAGFPPFNGFISEWLTLQALFAGQNAYRSGASGSVVILPVLLVTLIMLAISFAMTALAFAKIAGETLLGFPRRAAVPLSPAPASMRAVMLLLAVLCLLLGLMPWLLLPWLSAAVPFGEAAPSVLDVSWQRLTVTVPAAAGAAPYRATLPVIPLLALVVLPVLLTLLSASGRRRQRPVWVGGEPFEPATMQYTGPAFSALLWERLSSPPSRADPGEPLPAAVHLSGRHTIVEYFNARYDRILQSLATTSERFGDWIQSGDIRTYLLYIFAACLGVLILLVVGWRP